MSRRPPRKPKVSFAAFQVQKHRLHQLEQVDIHQALAYTSKSFHLVFESEEYPTKMCLDSPRTKKDPEFVNGNLALASGTWR